LSQNEGFCTIQRKNMHVQKSNVNKLIEFRDLFLGKK